MPMTEPILQIRVKHPWYARLALWLMVWELKALASLAQHFDVEVD